MTTSFCLQRRRFLTPALAMVLGGLVGVFGLVVVATASTVTDPTGSASVGVPAGGGNHHAQGSLVGVSLGGCARSGLVAASYGPTGYDYSGCPWGGPEVQAPVAVSDNAGRDTQGAVSASDTTAWGTCWNPLSLGCLPSVVISQRHDAHRGTVSLGSWNCSAQDWLFVPGIAVCTGGPEYDQDSSSGSVAVNRGGAASGRLLALSVRDQGGMSWWWDDNNYDARAGEGVAVSENGNAHGKVAAASVNDSAYAAPGGVAVSTGYCGGYHADTGTWVAPSHATTGNGGVAVGGCNATGGLVAIAHRGDARTQSGGLLAVSALGRACGGTVSIAAGGNC